MTDKQPDALRLADWLETDDCDLQPPMDAAAELRRLQEENERIKAEPNHLIRVFDNSCIAMQRFLASVIAKVEG